MNLGDIAEVHFYTPLATQSGKIVFYRSEEMIYVTVQPNESIDSALKKFNMKLQQSGVLRELKEHGHYEKPSEKRRRKARRRVSRG
jgi:small subunit ribosomal protein S21